MSRERRLSQALIVGLGPGDYAHRTLLQAIVDTARNVFDAGAASILLLDEERHDLLFAAVAGEGAGQLLGRRIPANTGIAGSVLATRQPIVLDSVKDDPRFEPDVAESTGYVPDVIMAAPLAAEEKPIGVFEVLDPRDRSRSPSPSSTCSTSSPPRPQPASTSSSAPAAPKQAFSGKALSSR